MKRLLCLSACLAAAGGWALVAASAFAAPVYVDASLTNTQFAPSAGGGALTTNSTDTADGIWRLRTSLGIDPAATAIPSGTITLTASNNVFESTGNSNPSDNVPRVVTTISGLASNTYNVWVLYWIDQAGSPWRIRAGLTDSVDPLPLFIGGGAGTPPTNEPAGAVDSANRVLWKASLGQVTGTSINVYVEDAPATTNNERTWYDGVAYEAVPEPSALALAMAGAAGVLGLRRRRR
jgi:hypothetical protein